jgi:prophage regulatory protein
MNAVASPHRMLRLPQVKDMVGLSKSAIYNRIAEGTFPKAINLGGKSVGWIELEVIEWLNARIAASRTAA